MKLPWKNLETFHKEKNMPMKNIIIILFLFLESWSVIGLAQTINNKVEVSGLVIDCNTKEPIPYASVTAILQPGGTIIQRTVPNRNGAFQFDLKIYSQYTILVSCIGMKTVRKNIDVKASSINLPTITLKENTQQLDEVTILGRKKRISLTENGFAYDFKSDKTLISESLLYALKKVPLVSVDGDGNLSVKGGTDYTIYLNGKPYTLANSNTKEVLQSIPASSIDKVEVITNPDARYDISKGSTILNIITRKNQPDNYRIILNAEGNTHPSENGSINFLLTKGKLSTSLGYSINNRKFNHIPSSSHTEIFLDGGNKATTTQDWEADGRITSHLIKGLLEYNIDTLNSIYADANFLLQYTKTNTTYNNNYNTHSTPYYFSKVYDNIKQHDGSQETNISYRNIYPNKKGERFLLTYRYTFNPDNKENNVIEHRYTDIDHKDEWKELIHKANSKGGLSEHTIQADYSIPINNHTISIGLKDIYRRSKSDPVYYQWKAETEEWTPVNIYADNEINAFKQKQNIVSAYLSYQLNISCLSFKAGVRTESAYNKIEYRNKTQNSYSYHTFDWMPRISCSYNLSRYSNLSLSYVPNVKRASIWQMNPYRQQLDEFTVEYGNPDIRSEKIKQINLSYYYFSNFIDLAIWTDYSNIKNAIVRYPFQKRGNDKTIEYTYDNLGNYNKITGFFYISYRPSESLSFNMNGSVGRTYMKSDLLDFKQHDTHYSLSASGDWWLKKKLLIGAQWAIFQQEPEMQIAYNKFQKYSFYIQKRMFENKLNVRLNINNPFRDGKYREAIQTVQNGTFSRQTKFSIVAFNAMLNLSYSFGSGKTTAKRKKRIENDDLLQKTGVR